MATWQPVQWTMVALIEINVRPEKDHMQTVALVLSVSALIYVLWSSPLRGLSRFLAPDATAFAMLTAIFGIRPLFRDRFDMGGWYGMYIPDESQELTATYVGMLAFTGLTLGVFLMTIRPTRRQILGDQALTAATGSESFTAARVLTVTGLAAGLYIVMLIILAGPAVLGQLSAGRSSDIALGGIPEIVMMLPMIGPVAAALFFLVNRERAIILPQVAVILLSMLVSVVLLSQLGNRRFIIPAILIPLSAALIRKPVRIKLWHIVVGIVGVLFVAIIPMVRAAGARRPGESILSASFRYLQDEGVVGVLEPIFSSFDTEMFDYIAVASATLGDNSYGYGRGTILEFVLRPIPGASVGGVPWSDAMITRLFGGGCGQPFCPVASLPGVLYFDGGLALVLVGSVAAGAGLRYLTNRWKYNQHLSTFQLLAVVIMSAFALIAARTNTVHAMWWAIYTIVLSMFVYLWATQQKTLKRSALGRSKRHLVIG